MAANVRVSITGIEAAKEAVRRRVNTIIAVTGAETRETIIGSITAFDTPVDGPSAPGEPPHRDEGPLSRSIRLFQSNVMWIIGSPLEYARWLEFGTRNMAARPFLRPGLMVWLRLIRNFRGGP